MKIEKKYCSLCKQEITDLEDVKTYEDVLAAGLWYLYNDLKKLTENPNYTDCETMEQVRRNVETLHRLVGRL